jgi:hypothetical protein
MKISTWEGFCVDGFFGRDKKAGSSWQFLGERFWYLEADGWKMHGEVDLVPE